MKASLDEPLRLPAEGEGATTTPAGAFRRSLAEWLEIKDWEAVNIVMATAAALYLPGDPVWTIVVGPSGGGKTELLMSFTGSEDVQLLSSLTSHTLLSGLQGKKNQDLLFRLDKKLLLIKDLSPLFSMQPDQMREIMSQLRDAFDGDVVRSWGSGKETAYWRGSFGLLSASTIAIEGKWKFFAELGERFLRVDLEVDAAVLVAAALDSSGGESEMRPALKQAGCQFMNHCKEISAHYEHTTEPAVIDRIAALATMTAIARTPVQRDRYHQITHLPQPEIGSRLGKQLLRLAQSSAFIHGRERITDDDYELLLRVARDCIPNRRRAVLGARLAGLTTAAEIGEQIGLARQTVSQDIEDLKLLGALDGSLLTESGLGDYMLRKRPPMTPSYPL